MTLNNVAGFSQAQAVSTPNFKAEQTDQIPEVPVEKTSHTGRNILLGLAALGAITFGVIKYRNAQALKPVIDQIKTKDGGLLTKELKKAKILNPDGTSSIKVVERVNTFRNKEGKVTCEVTHNFLKNERYSVYFDKDGNISKTVVGRMSPVDSNGKVFLEQASINKFTRNADEVVTDSQLVDHFSGKKNVIAQSRTVSPIEKPNTLPAPVAPVAADAADAA